jgi:hypothetical protein
MPLIVLPFSVRPAGSEPGIDQVYGGVPPVTVRTAKYGEPGVPLGIGGVVVIVSGTAESITVAVADLVESTKLMAATVTVCWLAIEPGAA